MRTLERLVAAIRRAIGRDRFETEINEELEFHIDAHADELVSRGVPRPEALRQARLKFGSREKYRQEGREISRYRMADEIHADLRDAFRGLKRDRSFAVVATSVIASVLAVNMVLFAFLDAYFLRPLPIDGADRHVEVSARDDQKAMLRMWPLADIDRLLVNNPVLESGYAFTQRRVIVGGKNPARAYVEVVSPSYFKVMKPRMATGRTPSSEPTSPVEPSILLSHNGWKHLLDSDPAPLGKTLMVDGTPLTAVGVLEDGAGGLEPVTPEFWMLAGAADKAGANETYMIGALLREGVSDAQAAAALMPIFRSLLSSRRETASAAIREAVVELRPTLLRESGDLRPLAISLLFLFGLVTAIAAANLTSMHLARAMSRRHDLSIRAALGASRGRLIRHLLTEGVLVALVAAIIAWGLAVGSVAAVQGVVFSLVTDAGMSMLPVRVDLRIVLSALALALIIGIGCGLVPALQTTSTRGAIALKRDGLWLGGAMSAGRLRGALVVLQVALSLPLLVSAGVLVKSANQAARTDVGYSLDGLIDLRPDAPSKRLLDRLRATPGVRSVTVAAQTPLGGPAMRVPMRAEGQEAILLTNQVDERFFGTLGIALREGRTFYPHEVEKKAPVVVISETTARRLWPDKSALGRTIDIEDTEATGVYHPYEVVGVVANVMSGFFFHGMDASNVYRPGSFSLPDVMVRADTENAATFAALKQVCLDAGAFCEPYTMKKMLAMQRVPFEVASLIASSLGFLALGLACLGLHGLVRFAVVQRTREFGVRLALGSTRRQILANVLGESVRRVAWGLGFGLPACLALSAFIGSRVRILDSFDPITYSVVPFLLLAASVVASLFPALKAAGTDPIKALREE